jgi:betaine lipid synthase
MASTTGTAGILATTALVIGWLAVNPKWLDSLVPEGWHRIHLAMLVSLAVLGLTILTSYSRFQAILKFCYSCFFKPLGNNANQQTRLESFYKDQAEGTLHPIYI